MPIRHCLIRQNRVEGQTFQREVVLGGVTLVFDGDGVARNQATGQMELPEVVGLFAEKRPQRYAVEYKDGPVPGVVPNRLPRAIVERRPEPPTVEELVQLGVDRREAPLARAYQRYLHAQEVFPYGQRPVPPEGSEAMLQRYIKQERERAAGKTQEAEAQAGEVKAAEKRPADDAGGEEKRAAPKKSHYERRRDELQELAQPDNEGGVDRLRQIVEGLGLEPSTSKRDMVDAILGREFPREHAAFSKATGGKGRGKAKADADEAAE